MIARAVYCPRENQPTDEPERFTPEADIAQITEAYERARYGHEPLAEDAVAVAQEGLERIRERAVEDNVS